MTTNAGDSSFSQKPSTPRVAMMETRSRSSRNGLLRNARTMPGASSMSASKRSNRSDVTYFRPCSKAHSFPVQPFGNSRLSMIVRLVNPRAWALALVQSLDRSSIRKIWRVSPWFCKPRNVRSILSSSFRAGIRAETSSFSTDL
jgi:hypothetical protein